MAPSRVDSVAQVILGRGLALGSPRALTNYPDRNLLRLAYFQLETWETPAMQLTDFVRGVPDDVWALFEPILPPAVWQGNGRRPIDNRRCLHALLYVLASGIGWEYLPAGFPSYKTVQRRLQRWSD